MLKTQTLISFAAGAAVCGTLAFGLGFAQPEKGQGAEKRSERAQPADPSEMTPEMMEQMFAEMAEKATPGAAHEKLADSIGHWHVQASFGQGEEAMTGTGTMHVKWILGKRYTHADFKLDDFMGQPFHGVAITGYSNYTEQYQSVWMDTMTTHMSAMKGAMEDGVLTMRGTSMTPMGETPMKLVTTMEGDTWVDTFYDGMPDGSWVQSGTITYTRAKEGG
ncbi:MAG: DUF1579 family protein [Phycisphaerales bacterium JB040]